MENVCVARFKKRKKEMGGEGALCGRECGWKEKVKEEEGPCFGDDKKPLPDKGTYVPCALPFGVGEPLVRCSLIDPELWKERSGGRVEKIDLSMAVKGLGMNVSRTSVMPG